MRHDVDVHVVPMSERDGRRPVVLVSVHGEIDLRTAPDLRATLRREFVRGAGTVVLELSGVTFFGASGLALLVDANDLAATNGQHLVLNACSPAVLRVLDLTATRSLFAAP